LEIYPTSLGAEPQLWWLSFLLYHRLLWLWFKEGYLHISVC